MRGGKDGLVGTSGRHSELDPADTDGDERPDLEELAADGAASGIGQIGGLQGNPAQVVDQHISHRGEPQAELVGRHGAGRGAVGEQVDLTLLDAVLHLAAGTVDILVEMAAIAFSQRGDDEAGVCLPRGPLGLGDDAPLAAPALAGQPGKVLEAARRLAGLLALLLGLGKLGLDRPGEAGVPRQAEDIIDRMGFAPRHQAIARKARIGAQDDAHLRPARADLRHDAGDLLHRTGGAIDIRRPQLRGEQMPATEHVQRQIAVAIVIAMEEPPFLMAMQRIVGGVEIEDDFLGRSLVGVQENPDEQARNGRRVMRDLVIAGRRPPGSAPDG